MDIEEQTTYKLHIWCHLIFKIILLVMYDKKTNTLGS